MGVNYCDVIKENILPDLQILQRWSVTNIMGSGSFGIVLAIQKDQERRVVKLARPTSGFLQSIEQEALIQFIMYKLQLCPELYKYSTFMKGEHVFYLTLMEGMDITLAGLLKCIDDSTSLKQTFLRYLIQETEPLSKLRASVLFLFFYVYETHMDEGCVAINCRSVDTTLIHILMTIVHIDDRRLNLDKLMVRYVRNTRAQIEWFCQKEDMRSKSTMRHTQFSEELSKYLSFISTAYHLEIDGTHMMDVVRHIMEIDEIKNVVRKRYIRLQRIMTVLHEKLLELKQNCITHGDMHPGNIMGKYIKKDGVYSLLLRFIDTGQTSLHSHVPLLDICQFLRCLSISHISLDIQAFFQAKMTKIVQDVSIDKADGEISTIVLEGYDVVTDWNSFNSQYQTQWERYITDISPKNKRVIQAKYKDFVDEFMG